jgi:uncharacterized protein YqfA (UPF0365 family)
MYRSNLDAEEIFMATLIIAFVVLCFIGVGLWIVATGGLLLVPIGFLVTVALVLRFTPLGDWVDEKWL